MPDDERCFLIARDLLDIYADVVGAIQSNIEGNRLASEQHLEMALQRIREPMTDITTIYDMEMKSFRRNISAVLDDVKAGESVTFTNPVLVNTNIAITNLMIRAIPDCVLRRK